MSAADPGEAASRTPYRGPIFFEYGFRPFFLGAGVHAVIATLIWIAWVERHTFPVPIPFLTFAGPVPLWHAHEMVYGFGLAVVAGFFLTAVPNWTGRRPVSGTPLAVLFGLWVATRLASLFSVAVPPLHAAVAEIAFIGMLSALVAQALLSGWSKRNFVFLPVLAALLAGASLYHMEATGLTESTARVGHLLGLDALLVLITVVGGRIIPAFTTNALRRDGAEQLPRTHDRRDVAAIAAMVLLAVADLLAPGAPVTGWIAIAAGLAGALRMGGWRTSDVVGAPILWILHIGYGWLVAGLLLKGIALVEGTIPEVAGLHALGIGAVGSMTIGVMSRAALGHTGRMLEVAPAVTIAYGLITLAALTRVAAAVLPDIYDLGILTSGICWLGAFLLFVIVYWPILTRPRITARPT